ncbi:MAG: SEL1-like repeat protein [Erysipelotrichaceae bacterium]|nr:SEL1-like repeat protein [Erysipelotrichaceae bacterium]
MYNLGMMYKNGEYVFQNIQKAKSYFENAAAKGHELAQKELDKLK